MRYRVAVDVGGTFTDVVLTDGKGARLVAIKVPTTPSNRADGVMNGIQAVAEAAGIRLDAIEEVVHGSTTGTNALIERTGARVGLLVTAGFRDLLEIGRVMRPKEGLYDFTVDRPPPLVPRRLCLEAVERVDAAGTVLTPLDEASVEAAAAAFAAAGVEAVAICSCSRSSIRRTSSAPRNSRRAPAGPPAEPVLRGEPRIPRIRARQYHRDERLSRRR
ncbi:MAG: hydantoinase/oxoprolinase N-terminal domain-containing protein [Alphaproteobacteria bacterium]